MGLLVRDVFRYQGHHWHYLTVFCGALGCDQEASDASAGDTASSRKANANGCGGETTEAILEASAVASTAAPCGAASIRWTSWP